MFLVVFVSLVISIIGLYAQVLSIQTNKIYHAQYGLMQTMITWHGAAVSLIKPYIANGTTITGMSSTTGCQVTKANTLSINGNSVNICKVGASNLVVSSGGTLPSGYSPTPFTFTSVAYQTLAAPIEEVVITFVYATEDPTTVSNILLPGTGGTSIGFTIPSLTQQFARAAPTNIGYGTVTASGTFSVNILSAGGSTNAVPYSVPTIIPVGAFGIISSVN